MFKVVDGKALRAKVDIGQRRDGKVEVVQGLAAEDIVVTAGQLKLRDGVPVRVANGSAAPAVPARRPAKHRRRSIAAPEARSGNGDARARE